MSYMLSECIRWDGLNTFSVGEDKKDILISPIRQNHRKLQIKIVSFGLTAAAWKTVLLLH